MYTENLILRDELQLIGAAVKSPRLRRALILRVYQDYTFKDLSEFLGVSIDRASQIVNQALRLCNAEICRRCHYGAPYYKRLSPDQHVRLI